MGIKATQYSYYQTFLSFEERQKAPDWVKKIYGQRQPVTRKEVLQMFAEFEVCITTIMMLNNVGEGEAQSEYFRYIDERFGKSPFRGIPSLEEQKLLMQMKDV